MILAFPSLFNGTGKIYRVRTAVATASLAVLAGCATPPPAVPYDPQETENREVHAFNKSLDQHLVKPIATTYGAALPAPVQESVANFAENLELPGFVVNHALQMRPNLMFENTIRFAINTTVGIGGLFDPAAKLGLPARKTDFGETLHVWGAPEGPYMELPALGPSTGRDTAGKIVDVFLDPVGNLIPSPEKYAVTAAKVGSKLGDRSRYSETLDSVLYDSADSYSQTRLLYLQNRRFELGQSADGEADFLDPYEDPYGQ